MGVAGGAAGDGVFRKRGRTHVCGGSAERKRALEDGTRRPSIFDGVCSGERDLCGMRRRERALPGRGDGKIMWSILTGNGIDSSPALVGDTLLIGSQDFFVYALDANSGAVRWKYETGLGVSSARQYRASGGRKQGWIFVRAGSEHGKTAVENARGGSDHGAGGVWRFHDLYAVVGITGAGRPTGKVIWRAGLGTGVQNAPVISGETMYLTSDGGDVYALE